MSLTESIVEDAALTWFGELGYAVGHGPHLAPSEPAAERDAFGEVVLVGRLREAIRRLNPAIPEEAREEALRKVLQVGTPALQAAERRVGKRGEGGGRLKAVLFSVLCSLFSVLGSRFSVLGLPAAESAPGAF